MRHVVAQEQFVQALVRTSFFSRREMAELPNLLMKDEQVLSVVSGFYTAGTAILCITSKRLLLVDKKFIRLSIEDIRYDSIREIDYSHQAMIASIRMHFSGRRVEFKSWHKNELRMISQQIQQKMFEVREKLHREPEADVAHAQEAKVLFEEVTPETSPAPVNQYRQDPQLERYLQERIARWRQASRFVDTLTVTSKAGKQILKLEAEQ